jgi:hypothetical protein
MKIEILGTDPSGESDDIYCALTVGHVPFEDFFKAVNEDWSDAWADHENCRHEYAIKTEGGWDVHKNKETPGAIPITIAYWEEPYGPN